MPVCSLATRCRLELRQRFGPGREGSQASKVALNPSSCAARLAAGPRGATMPR
jgi:hypothetical protein